MLRLLLPYFRHSGSFALYCIGDLDTYHHCLSLVITCMWEQIQHELLVGLWSACWLCCIYSAQNAFTGMILPAEVPPASSNGGITDGLFKYMAIFAISYYVATSSKDAVIKENIVRSCWESDEKYEREVTCSTFLFPISLNFMTRYQNPPDTENNFIFLSKKTLVVCTDACIGNAFQEKLIHNPIFCNIPVQKISRCRQKPLLENTDILRGTSVYICK